MGNEKKLKTMKTYWRVINSNRVWCKNLHHTRFELITRQHVFIFFMFSIFSQFPIS